MNKGYVVNAARKNNHGMNMLVLHTKPIPCGGQCLYCFSESGLNSSMIHSQTLTYAQKVNWSPTAQLKNGIDILQIKSVAEKKFSLAIKGDSFTNYSFEYLESYFKEIYEFFNGKTSSSFEEAREEQKTAKSKCVFISVSTRPDLIDESWCKELIRLGVSSVELGVQNLVDSVLLFNKRGHSSEQVIHATGLLKKYGFEVGYHMMPGLPSSTPEIDFMNCTELLWKEQLYPDYIKLYPCILLNNYSLQPKLYEAFKAGQWLPLNDDDYLNWLYLVLPYIPRNIFISRFQRIIPEDQIAYGPKKRIDRKKFNGINKCIVQRAVQHSEHINAAYEELSYTFEEQLSGKDISVQVLLQDDTVLAYLRGTFDDNRLLLRDIRVFGYPGSISDRAENSAGYIQHHGIGKKLVNYIETIARNKLCEGIILYPTPGIEEYFLKLGYSKYEQYLLIKKVK